MARSMVDRSHDVTVVTGNSENTNPPSDLPYELVQLDLEHSIPTISAYKIQRTMKKLQNKTDVFHVFTPVYLSGAGIYCAQKGTVPVIARLNSIHFCTNTAILDGECYKQCSTRAKFKHDPNSLVKKAPAIPFYFYRTHLLPKVANKIDKFIALAPGVQQVYNINGVCKKKLVTIPNFHEPIKKTPIKESEHPSDNSLRILYVGRLTSGKGVDVLINSLKHINKRKVMIDIIGDGEKKDRLVDLAREISADDCIQFHGRVDHDHIAKYYIESDVFVHPMVGPYTFSRTILESLQFSTVPIVDEVGDAAELIGDTGYIYENRSPSSLAEVIQAILDNPKELEKKKRRCNDVLERFSQKRIVDQIELQYRKLTNQKNKSKEDIE